MRKILISNSGWSSREENFKIKAFMLEYKPIIDVFESSYQDFWKILGDIERKHNGPWHEHRQINAREQPDYIEANNKRIEFENKLDIAISQLNKECREKFGKIPDTGGKAELKTVEVDDRVFIIYEDSDEGCEEMILKEHEMVWI